MDETKKSELKAAVIEAGRQQLILDEALHEIERIVGRDLDGLGEYIQSMADFVEDDEIMEHILAMAENPCPS